MTFSVCPLRSEYLKEWLHDHVVRPHQEGIERLKRAWSGIDIHCILQRKLSLKERFISLITGVALTFLPFFNFAIWKGWETFGNPEVLSSHFSSGNATRQKQAEPVPIERMERPTFQPILETPPSVQIQPTHEVLRTEAFKHVETEGDAPPIFCDGKIQYFADHILITKESAIEKVKCRYSLDWKLLEYNLATTDGKKIFQAHADGEKITVKAQKSGRHFHKEHLLKHHLPWIQQPILCLREFVLSQATQTKFCAIDPSDLSLAEFTAKRKREEQVKDYGTLVRIEFSISGIKSLAWKGIGWADPVSGEIRKLTSDILFRPLLTIATVRP